jgi:glycosyltransferase involved in cell wall biosynthesis
MNTSNKLWKSMSIDINSDASAPLASITGSPKGLRVLAVIPGEADDPSSMVFARRQMSAVGQNGINVQTFYLSSRTSLSALVQEFVRFRSVINDFQPDVVHAHYGTVTALFCALATTRSLVITFRGSDLNPTTDTGYMRSFAGRFFSQIAALRSQHNICVSQELHDRLWLRLRPTSIIFDGVDLSVFYPRPQEEARQLLGWSEEKKYVFFNLSGRPAGKRLALAEQGIELARRQLGEVELVAVSKVDPNKIPLLMNACDCLLLTSDWEGSPTVVKEATACNLPVIAVDVGDIRMLLDEVEPSRIVPVEAEAISDALVSIIRAGERSNGRLRAEKISSQSTTCRLIEVYCSVLANAGSLRGSSVKNAVVRS